MALRREYRLSAADIWGRDGLPAWEIDVLLATIPRPDVPDDAPPDTAGGAVADPFAEVPAQLRDLL